jgi:hypothetical protein
MHTSKVQIRLISPWNKQIETSNAVFSTEISTQEADALLCEWAPSHELLSFPRRKAWYCCEPACQFEFLGRGDWPRMRAQLAPHEFLWHGHSDPQFRVPHVTHFSTLGVNRNPDRIDKAVAIVSNHGGSPWKCHPQIALRNQFITHPAVDLYGRAGWNRYRRRWYSYPRPPANYRGELPGDWHEGQKRQLQAKYKASVCFENMCEPHYFTEKLVEAAIAGCIPVYRADPTLRDTVLDSAFWIDPQDFGGSVVETLGHALKSDRSLVQEQNSEWLRSNRYLRETHLSAVFSSIASILMR